jgi:hypothetical protein
MSNVPSFQAAQPVAPLGRWTACLPAFQILVCMGNSYAASSEPVHTGPVIESFARRIRVSTSESPRLSRANTIKRGASIPAAPSPRYDVHFRVRDFLRGWQPNDPRLEAAISSGGKKEKPLSLLRMP